MTQLEFLVSALADEKVFTQILTGTEMIDSGEGYGYFPIPSDGELVRTCLPELNGAIDDCELNLLVFTQDMPLHRHKESDGFMQPVTFGPHHPCFWEGCCGTNDWTALSPDRPILVPRGHAHGFRSRQKNGDRHLYVITANNPPPSDEDIEYI